MKKIELKTSISNIDGVFYITSRIVVSEVYTYLKEQKTLAIYLVRQKVPNGTDAQETIKKITHFYFND